MSRLDASAGIRVWLPIQAATGPRVRDALETAVDQWWQKWFAAARPGATTIEARSAGAPRLAGGWLLHGGAVAVPADGPETFRLAGLALAADPESLVLSEPDRDILSRLAATISADLAAALGATLGCVSPTMAEATPGDDPLGGDAGIVVRVTDAQGRPLVSAAIPLATLVPFVKAGIEPGKADAPLARITRAIERTATRIDVRLGRTSLSLGELAGLAAGDVLVLDRSVEDGAELALHGRPFARAGLEQDDATTRLILSAETRDA
jgi:hypothetical protein